MGQKVNPHGMRVGVIKDWDSRWYARDEKVGDLIVEDYKIRQYLKKTLYSAGIPNIEIERDSAKVRIYIHCSRPGVVIGKGGAEIERIRLSVEKMIGKPVALSIVEVRTPDTNAQLVAENIAAQLEKRIGFRRAMKNAMGRAMRMGARGIKIMCSGRLGGAEIARTECYHEGTIPLQTIRADIEYGFAEAATTYGRVGVKVWIYKGEILSQSLRTTPRTMDLNKRDDRRRDRRDGDRRGRGGYNRDRRDGNRQGGRPGYQGGGRPQNGERRGGFQGQDGERRPQNGDRRGGQRGGASIPKAPIESKPLTKESRTRTDRNNDRNRKNSGEDKFDRLEKKNVSRGNNTVKNQKNNKPQTAKPAPAPEKKEDEIRNIVLPETMTIRELADKMKVQAAAIVKKLFMQGKIVTVNHEIDYETAEEIALEFNCIAEPEEKVDVIAELLKEDEEDESKMVPRPPVVCVMGHVDHGKTSLLDAIRHTHVIAKEAGGITQHIGAYMVTINGQKITFLDTPGHEAFTAMRMRGANSTDIAILVVAADDGVMPQTIEAINHAKAAGIEIIVAINKIDKPSANIERVKQELSEYELIPEDWGGSTICVPVSAHTGEGIDTLLEMILLTAEVNELKANPNRKARGLVIEAQLDKGKGPVATILVQKGTLHVGDYIAAGACSGKVRAMMDDKGRRVKEAGPSTPVEILGLSDVPNAGEILVQTDNDKEAKNFAATFVAENKKNLLEETKAKMSLDDLFNQIQEGNLKELALVVKADVQGSVEAVKQSLVKLSNEEVAVRVIHGGVGAINESDVMLATASSAIIIGFNVRPDANAKSMAEQNGVDIRLYRVIYQAIEDVEAAMKGMLEPVYEEKVIGHAEVRQLFKASGVGTIAGSYVLDGTFQRGCKVRISREGNQIFEGNLASLKRFKDDVKEVRSGYECGLVFEGFNDLQEFDQVEAYIMVEVPR